MVIRYTVVMILLLTSPFFSKLTWLLGMAMFIVALVSVGIIPTPREWNVARIVKELTTGKSYPEKSD